MSRPQRIRPIVICVFRHGNRILVEAAFDHTKQQEFYRPPGGGIHFGERSDVALHREIQEELGVKIEYPRLLGVLENLFTLEGAPGHEVVFIYDAQFKDKALYESDGLKGRESNGHSYDALWIDIGSMESGSPPLYPDGLLELLRR